MATSSDQTADASAGSNLFSFSDSAYKQQTSQCLLDLRRDQQFTDFTLKCGTKQLACHRVTLAAGSPYFHQLLTSGQVTEAAEIPALSGECFQAILDYIYTAELQVEDRYVKELVKGCEHIQLSNLKQACDEFLANTIGPVNCVGMYMFAMQYGLDETKEKSKEVLLEKVDDLLSKASPGEFKALTEGALVELISDDGFDLGDESKVFELVEKWVKADSKRDTEECIARVLQHVRLALCHPKYLVQTVNKSSLVRFARCQQLLHEAKDYALMKSIDNADGLESEKTRPRKSDSSRFIFVIGGGKTCWKLDMTKKEWVEMCTLPQGQQSHLYKIGACMIGKDLIICGGSIENGGGDPTCNVWNFNIVNKTWTSLPSMSVNRRTHGVATNGKDLYVFGGKSITQALKSVEMLDLGQQQWKELASMTKAAPYNFAFYISGKMYVVSPDNKTTQLYDMERNVWSVKAAMPNGPTLRSCIAHQGQFIYVTGWCKKTPCLRYDTNTDQWTQLVAVRGHEHDYGSLVPHRGKLYLCGGDTTTIEEYDVDSDQWTVSDIKMPQMLKGHCMIGYK